MFSPWYQLQLMNVHLLREEWLRVSAAPSPPTPPVFHLFYGQQRALALKKKRSKGSHCSCSAHVVWVCTQSIPLPATLFWGGQEKIRVDRFGNCQASIDKVTLSVTYSGKWESESHIY